MMDVHREAFREEARELLEELEAALLELERVPDDEDLIGRVFRAMHTIKGSGAMFGFDAVASFTHHVETVYDAVRNRKMQVSKPLIDLTLSACDEIKKMVFASDTEVVDCSQSSSLCRPLLECRPMPGWPPKGAPLAVKATPAPAESHPGEEKNVTYRSGFIQSQYFCDRHQSHPIDQRTQEMGHCSVAANTGSIPGLDEIDPEACYTYWDIILTTMADMNAVRDVFIFAEDAIELKIEVIDDGEMIDSDEDYKKLGEILIERGDLSARGYPQGHERP